MGYLWRWEAFRKNETEGEYDPEGIFLDMHAECVGPWLLGDASNWLVRLTHWKPR